MNYYQGHQPAIVQQPQAGFGFNNTVVLQPGLECLLNVDQLLVKQEVELLEIVLRVETENSYQIWDNAGHQLFYAKEDSDCLTRNCCGPIRPFDMVITDSHGKEVIHLYRPLACQCCCFPCCLQMIEVHSPRGNIIGRVQQEWSCMVPQFKVLDAHNNVVLRMKGPCCTSACYGNVEFQVLSACKAVEVGKISKQWSGVVQEAFTDADNFGISFPMDLDIKMKAVMIGACMLIDFMFFESRPQTSRS